MDQSQFESRDHITNSCIEIGQFKPDIQTMRVKISKPELDEKERHQFAEPPQIAQVELKHVKWKTPESMIRLANLLDVEHFTHAWNWWIPFSTVSIHDSSIFDEVEKVGVLKLKFESEFFFEFIKKKINWKRKRKGT